MPFDLGTLPHGWFPKNQVNILWQLVQLTNGPILEVGPWIGRSTCVILEAMKHNNVWRQFHTVDFGISSEAEWERLLGERLADKANAEDYRPHVLQPGGSIVSLLKNLGERGFMERVSVHRADVRDLRFETKFDLIFCDASHTEDEIDRNVPKLLEMLNPGGILACDDINSELHNYLRRQFSWEWEHVDSLLFYGAPVNR
ncbi:class I SAM-dependent methyltransferase [Brevundimonas sp.]|uniref:class I SAM-dependent methyltransferase n=1 Tax=Brevundimonas sp. TaxID=1871086 RepID=UPI0037C18E7D